MSRNKEWYRHVYLRSDPWKHIRAQVLELFESQCAICKKEDQSNDVHHIWYDDLRFCYEEQFVLLCRDCHTEIHKLTNPKSCQTTQSQRKAIIEYKNAIKIISPAFTNLKKKSKEERRNTCSGCRIKNLKLYWFDPAHKKISESEIALPLCLNCMNFIIDKLKLQTFNKHADAWDFCRETFRARRKFGLIT